MTADQMTTEGVYVFGQDGGVQISNSSDDTYYVPKAHDVIFYIAFLVKCVVLVLGTVGNGVLVFIFARHKNFRTATTIYILSIAISDLMVTFSCPAVMIVSDVAGTWPLGVTTCKFSQATMEFSTCATVLALTALSIERFYAIMYPIKSFLSKKGFTITVNVLIWGVAMLFSAPKLMNSGIVQKRVKGIQGYTVISYCVPKSDKNIFTQYFSLLDVFLFYAIPFCIISVLYTIISCRLKESASFSKEKHHSIRHENQMKKRNKVAKMTFILTAIFFVSYLPYNALRLRIYFLGGTDNYWNNAAGYAYCFGCLHFWLNPLAMYAFCDTFRKYYNKYLFCSSFLWQTQTTKSKSQVQWKRVDTAASSLSASDRFSQVNQLSPSIKL